MSLSVWAAWRHRHYPHIKSVSQSGIFRLTGRTDISDRQNRLVLDRSQIEVFAQIWNHFQSLTHIILSELSQSQGGRPFSNVMKFLSGGGGCRSVLSVHDEPCMVKIPDITSTCQPLFLTILSNTNFLLQSHQKNVKFRSSSFLKTKETWWRFFRSLCFLPWSWAPGAHQTL